MIRRRPGVRAVFARRGATIRRSTTTCCRGGTIPLWVSSSSLLEEYDGGRTPALLDSLRAELAAYPAARIELREFENGPPIDAPIALRVQGPDLDTLRVLAAEVERVLKRTPGTQYVDNPVRLRRTDLRVTVDRAKAGMLGVPTLEIDRTLRLGIAGVEAGVLREADGDARDVVVRLAGSVRAQPADLDRLYVASNGGRLTPLRQVADVRFEADVPEIQRVRPRARGHREQLRPDRVQHRPGDPRRARRARLHPLPAGYRWCRPVRSRAGRRASAGSEAR